MAIFVKIVACKLQTKSPFLALAKILLFLSYCGAFEERSWLNGPPLKLIIMRKARFSGRVIFACVCAQNLCSQIIKIEATYERSSGVNVKVEPRSTSRLISAFYILPLFYDLRD